MSYKHGDHNVICDFSGFKIKSCDARKTWNGFLVHKDFWEPRHPQDFVRGRADRQRVDDTRPESDDNFLTANEVQASDL